MNGTLVVTDRDGSEIAVFLGLPHDCETMSFATKILNTLERSHRACFLVSDIQQWSAEYTIQYDCIAFSESCAGNFPRGWDRK